MKNSSSLIFEKFHVESASEAEAFYDDIKYRFIDILPVCYSYIGAETSHCVNVRANSKDLNEIKTIWETKYAKNRPARSYVSDSRNLSDDQDFTGVPVDF